ncbi:CRISPR-associated protein [Candidatus Vecturithrix granuli]|uniref:CRISPR-associated protein n=1 Tax=Vecturithrix granuli TaxID=1499967 RepID=A0A081CA97_VECG1|nr:CRISPR-associated protein [Candidatus Vecturithrix granuli]
MPFSIVINGFPKSSVPVLHIQGPALQGMFLHLLTEVDADTAERLHDDSRYRPYTLSPLGIHFSQPASSPSQEGRREFQGFRLPREQVLNAGTPCYLRLTLLEDRLFPIFSRYFLTRAQPTFYLGETEFTVTNVLATPENENPWSQYLSYAQLIERARQRRERRIKLHFITPTTFRKGDVDLPLPLPRLVFQSFQKRFAEFSQVEFLPDFAELVDQYTGISSQKGVRTDTIAAKNTRLTGFVGEVGFEISHNAPADLLFQMHLLADYAFFCGAGRKTTVGMGQTRRMF